MMKRVQKLLGLHLRYEPCLLDGAAYNEPKAVLITGLLET